LVPPLCPGSVHSRQIGGVLHRRAFEVRRTGGRRSRLDARRWTPVHVKDQIGRHGEELAVHHLQSDGFVVIDRNWRCALGEIDIVALDGDVLVVCEVKTRSGVGFGSPLEGVGWDKSARLRRLAGRWLAEHPGRRARGVRIDVVGVLRRGAAPATIEHVRGVE
jgi:putative endonuclease